ncbi:hypothetical protein BSQ39_08300 [Loigolactobacillus backii]|uniref:helix-turn-helix domain-containing protein n=1 Tax=Loigolactobacillus backii TaxID=375175 RepID=UPI000C1CAE69|nr:helix-turn-helix domain-containing protein [Loigolactobacillus backii]PIO83564.1 hypothetical protein BSQ39_08300 [Loigolactobacillus backii]
MNQTVKFTVKRSISPKTKSISDVARELKTKTTTVKALCNLGYLKALKLNSIRIPAVEVDRFVSNYAGYDFSNVLSQYEMELKNNDRDIKLSQIEPKIRAFSER